MAERLVVIGGGTMGSGIGYVAANAGYQVELVEVDGGRAAAALATLAARWDKAVRTGRQDAADAAAARDRLTTATALADLPSEPSVVIEAVPERVELKRQVLREAERLRPDLLASNTSSIAIGALAAVLASPDRFCGLHFFNPVWSMRLLEVVVGPDTAAATTDAALALAVRLGKEPIVVADAPGFASSRLGVALGLEAIRMVEAKVASPADIDTAMTLGYRHPMGPLELTDVVGLDVRLAIAETLREAYGDRFAPPDLLQRMVAEGRLGRKSGQGFYRWVDGKKVVDE
ncbi:3-hydroxyacyl-CoA dehydrogenase family protein [Actinocatenispora sera]|uniref:Putative 3-hydroxyacyl-CoA dehydrogenase n=1 Tax=Actinocatenispora sera TaxID=390989 RepID=A0A810KXK4_9ACTN|nr:3-hydroxyacyl-CoA dehydrogenase family protein [Actinocatenispora sera]BCJ26788.1 putative 3-hydroxyacyl-CoA dehydrogenase [Actinocatenispora sera]